ncbi:protein ASPARTIC PROTEASE IN GUARD CELL 1-like [Hordeum vulgare]|nr:protein ASPARTIC PROTEASE IN GUARD CELL 1-like [Hordeum vulgare]
MIQLLGKAGSQAFYVLLLQAIIVDRQQLEVPLSVFSAESVLDSVTVITRLSTAAYVALFAAFKAGMTEYPPVPPNGILDTCFNFTDKAGHSGSNLDSYARDPPDKGGGFFKSVDRGKGSMSDDSAEQPLGNSGEDGIGSTGYC